jgi:ABC transporter substrate binding protein (PQQ-dependent alcohol dehydrogenase system)
LGLPRWRAPALGGCLIAAALSAAPLQAADPIKVTITYLRQEQDRLPPLSLLDPVEIPDEGLAGAKLGLEDNATTGSFLGHDYELIDQTVPKDGDLVAAAAEALAGGGRLLVVDAAAEPLLAIADLPAAADALIFNVSAEDDGLRTDDCRANLFHTVPSRAMKADALAEYLVWKQWRDWLLIHGTTPADLAMKAAMERAATKFGAKIVETRTYEYEATARRTDSGHAQIQKQLPVFTQNAPAYDVLMVADESDVFGEYLPYRTWDPRPVVGTQGLVPTAWHRSHEQWGGTQMQSRFEKSAGRWMTELDYTAWTAVRAIGEAVTRTNAADPATLHAYLVGDQFELAAFKGEGLTFRRWNQQLRQPILLAAARVLVSVSPQEGFLHQRTPLDTLGYDQPESRCQLNAAP